jgi:hypothetical protein
MGEGGGVHAALVLELEEEAVAAAAREGRLERDRAAGRGAVPGVRGAVPGVRAAVPGVGAAVTPASTSRVRVDVGEVPLAQRNEVALGAQVVLELDTLAVASDVE